MPVRQSTRAASLVASALRLRVDPASWPVIEAQLRPAPLADQLLEVGQELGITFLTRAIDTPAVERAVREHSYPLVLAPSAQATDGELLVIAESGPGRPTLWSAPPDGELVRVPVSGPSEIATEVRRRFGDRFWAMAPTLAAASVASLSRAALDATGEAEIAAAEAEAREHVGSAVARLWTQLAKDKREILVVFFYAGLAGLFSLTLPLSVGAIVQLIQGGLILQSATILIAYVIVGTIVAGALQVLQLGVVERIQQRVFTRMALEYVFHLPRVRYATALQEDLPESVNRMFEAALIQKSLAKFLLDTSQALLTIFFGLVLLTFYHPYFSLVGLALVAVLAFIVWLTGPKGLATSLVESKYKYKTVHWLEEIARAFHAFKFAGRSELALGRMDTIVTKYLKFRDKHFKVLVQQAVSIVAFKTLITAGLLIVGTILVVNRQITLGQFVASELVVVTVLAGVEKLIFSLSVVYDILTSVEKAGHVTDLPVDAVGRTVLPVTDEGVRLEARGLGYHYANGEQVLHDVSLVIPAGQRVALTGFKGAGRSTLLRVMGGLLDDYDGTLLVDGISMHEVDREQLRERLGQMLSLTDLFEGSIRENITVGRAHLRDRDVWEALEMVGLDATVQEMRDGLDTRITNSGRSLPSNMAIKLLVAQCIVGAPRLVLFDDLFMNLLAEDRRRLLRLLTDPARSWTVIAVSHDPVLLESFDRVLVVRDGSIAADGSFSAISEDPYCAQLLEAFERGADVARAVRAGTNGGDA